MLGQYVCQRATLRMTQVMQQGRSPVALAPGAYQPKVSVMVGSVYAPGGSALLAALLSIRP